MYVHSFIVITHFLCKYSVPMNITTEGWHLGCAAVADCGAIRKDLSKNNPQSFILEAYYRPYVLHTCIALEDPSIDEDVR